MDVRYGAAWVGIELSDGAEVLLRDATVWCVIINWLFPDYL